MFLRLVTTRCNTESTDADLPLLVFCSQAPEPLQSTWHCVTEPYEPWQPTTNIPCKQPVLSTPPVLVRTRIPEVWTVEDTAVPGADLTTEIISPYCFPMFHVGCGLRQALAGSSAVEYCKENQTI